MAKKTAAARQTAVSVENPSADDLERIIGHLDTCYERGDDCIHPDTGVIVSDGEYDAMRRALKELRPDSELFQTATASELESTARKIKHDPPLTSIEKASHEDIATQETQLFKWMSDCLTEASEEVLAQPQLTADEREYKGEPVTYPEGYFYQAYKLDGVALALYYEDGKLVSAGLRPRDGINGEDVTEQAKFVSGVREKLKLKRTCSIRGEIVCKLSDFEKVQEYLADAGEKLRANPRNHAAGGIRQFKDPSKTKLMRLSFIGYGIEGLAKPPYHTEIERAAWCRDKLGIPYIETTSFKFEDLADMEAKVPELDIEVDGVIIGVNNLEDQEQLGRHGDPRTGNPKGKIAWKFREEEATPTIKEIQWQTGRTGKIVGVAIFDPVRLAGTNVTRATLHNAGFMKRNQITVGSTIGVRKAGKIIPKVTRVVDGQGEPEFPAECPSCLHPTKLVEGGSADMLELICENANCPAQNVSTLVHYLAVFGVLGLGESRVTLLVDGGAVEKPGDFYRLDVESAMACGLSRRQSLLAIGGIHMIPSPEKMEDDELAAAIDKAQQEKKSIPLAQLIAAFGIENAGASTGKALVDHFRDFDKIRSASVEELEEVEDIGAITAESIHFYLQDNAKLIDDLLQFVEPELPKTGALTGKTFCFSGSFEAGKRHWEKRVEDLGAKTVSSVSKKVDYLVAGPGSGSKSEKANKLGIEILNVEQLETML